MRSIRLGGSALVLASVMGLPLTAQAHQVARPAAVDLTASNSVFSGFVTKGPDAGTRVEGLLSLTAGAGAMALGGVPVPAPASAGMTSRGITLTVTLPMGVVKGIGSAAGRNAAAGTFTGPRTGDHGRWTAEVAQTVVSYGITGKVSSGPHRNNNALIGDLNGYALADGTMFGTYTDNSKVGPGIVPPVYAVHGTLANNMLTAGITLKGGTTFGLVGHLGKRYGQNVVIGAMTGPTTQDTGTWAGLDNAATP